LRDRGKISKTWMIGLVLLLIVIPGFLAAQGIQTPISVVSAQWLTSEGTATGTVSQLWVLIDAAPGDTNIRLRVTIQNLGNATISGVSADLMLQYPFKNATGGNTVRAYCAGSISPGVSADVDFRLNIDSACNPGEYKLDMVVNYLELATGVGKTLYFLKSTVVTVPVVVSATRYMVIYNVVASPSTTVPAGNITISGNLLNVGKISVYTTNVTIFSQALVRPASIIVGQVDPNVPRPFSSGIQLRRDIRPGEYPITISVTYSDAMATGHISQISLKLVVRQPESRPPPVTQRESGIWAILIQILRDLMSVLLGLAEMVTILR